jgi:endonuclease YncB( thermonuclease family)
MRDIQGEDSGCSLVACATSFIGQSHIYFESIKRFSIERLRFGIIAALVAITANTQTIQGRVVGISDGDTITVRDASRTQHAVRYARDPSYQDTIRGIAAAQESVPCKRS